MTSSKTSLKGRRRQRTIRSGVVAVSAATAGLLASRAARADITNGFAGFAAPNITAPNGATGIGYNTSSNTFELTNNLNGEAVSGFDTTAQDIASFDATYDYVATGSADGGAFVIQNNPAGTGALGNSGGSGGYQGMTNSAGLEYEYFGQQSVGFSTNGAAPAYQSTQNATLNNGDTIQVTAEYFNNTVTANFVDLKTGASGQRIFSGQNIPAAVGSNFALVGFTGATGGLASTQTVSNFTFVSGQTNLGPKIYEPIAVTGFNQQGIISVAGGQASVTATMDGGTNKNGDDWYEQGWNTFNTSTGLPKSGSTFTSQADSQHVFTMQSYSGDDVVLLNNVSSGTLTLATPTPYSALSFLTSSGNGPSSFKVTINYSDGAASTTGLAVISPDWFDGSPSAWLANGRDTLTSNKASQPDNYASGNPNLYGEDLILPDSTDPISSINMTYAAGGNIMVFAVSGVAINNAVTLYYDGSGATAGKFDNSTLTFGLNSSSGTPSAFTNGSIVVFDDTAADTVHNITVATVPGGIKPNALIFNNTTATNPYTLSGAGVSGPGGITLNGNGTVTLDNPNTFSGGATLNAGLLVIGSGGDLASSIVNVAPGSALNVSGGTLTSTSLNLSNGGTVNFAGSSLTLLGFGGTGAFNSTNATGTSLVLGNGTANSAGGTYSGPISLGTGSITVNGNASTMTLTGSNTYSGNTVLKSGVLLVANESLGSGTLNLSGGAIGAGTADTNIPNQIVGGALNVVSGGSVFELSNSANTFTGPIVVDSGTLQIDGASVIGSTTSLTVQSGATFLVNDTSGNAGQGTTLTISGTGVTTPGGTAPGPSGALRGADSVGNDVWAGTVNVSGTAYVAAGADGALYLTGPITGSGTLVFTSNANSGGGSLVVLAPSAPSTFSGETQLLAGPTVGTLAGVQLGANNGISPNSGLNILPGAAQPLELDLNGFNQSLTYLIGANVAGFTLTSTTGPSTLTITSGLKAGAQSYFATAITGNVSVVMNDPTGAGNQVLAGPNTYTGTTTITKGTLTAASSTALSTGPVTLNGGTLSLAAPGTVPVAPIVSSANFGSLVLNQGTTNTTTPFAPIVTGGSLQLTEDGIGGIANSAFFPTPVAVSDSKGFIATFQYQATSAGTAADGITFVLQNDPRGTAAVGGGGNSLAYAGATPILNSAAVEFETYTPNGSGYGTAFGSEGLVPGLPGDTTNYTSVLPINLTNNDLLDISLIYDGPAQTLLETIVDTNNGNTFSTSFSGIDYSALVGGPAGGSTTAYLGFTGSTGGAESTQTISNFNYSLGYFAPQSIGNAIVAATGTTSVIQIGASSGSTTDTSSVGAIQISSGATVHVTTLGSGVRGVLATPSITIAPTGQLDLGSNDLDIAAGGNTLAQVTALVASGYNNGKWNGSGIASSAAAADTTHLTALGVIVNDNGSGTPLYGTTGTIAPTFDGDTLAADGDILVKYTYYGDATLQGSVSATDYSRIDNGYLNQLTGWYNGDFNYDGVVNGSDYTLIDNAFNMQGGSNPLAEDASSTAQIAGGAGTSAVPEPASLGLFALGAAGLLGRRRRK